MTARPVTARPVTARPVAARPARGPRIAPERLIAGAWRPETVREILDKTVTVELSADLADLEPGERAALGSLLEVTRIGQRLYEDQLHPQALAVRGALEALHGQRHDERTADLLALYDLFQGPIATTLDNEQLPFVPVDGFAPGGNVYPWGIDVAEIEDHLAGHPEDRRQLLGLRTVVRRTDAGTVRRDLAALRRHPGLELLHPGLEDRLRGLLAAPGDRALYAVPYSLAWADEIVTCSRLLRQAADALPDGDDFGTFLRLRSRDLLADEYEAGDAAWVRGAPGRLNAVVGAYEPYEDGLFGAKAFFGVSVLHRNPERTTELESALHHLQALEDGLPYGSRRTVAADIPVAAYDVVADSGSQRHVGAQILPNEESLTRKYGRAIMLRENAIASPGGLIRRRPRWEAVMAPEHHVDLTVEGTYQQTLWHELGHYLGPLEDRANRLGEDGVLLEELKAELISLRAAEHLRGAGVFDAAAVAGVQAGMVIRMLLPVRPLRTQTYESMWLAAFNTFLEHGLLEATPAGLRNAIDRRPEGLTAVLGEVLAILDRGSKAEAEAWIARYATWDDRHQAIAKEVRGVERYRFTRYRYPALGD